MPDISNLKELAEIFETTVDDILDDEDSAEVLLSADSGKVTQISLDMKEFNMYAPLLSPQKNAVLLKSVTSHYADGVYCQSDGISNDEEIEKARTNIDLRDDNDKLANEAFENDNTAIFSIICKDISDESKQKLLDKAFENGKVSFFSILIKYFDNDILKEYADKAFNTGKVGFFSVLTKYLDIESLLKYRNICVKNGNVAFFALLSSKIKKVCDIEDEEL